MRCLKVLGSGGDWGDERQQELIAAGTLLPRGLHTLNHPMVRHAAAVYNGDPNVVAQRELIADTSDPPFWKVKSGRWRGAVWIDPNDGQAWLVDVGIRRADSPTDFYAAFLASLAAEGPAPFLPTADDRDRLKLEIAHERLRDWELSLYLQSVEVLLEAVETGYARGVIPTVLEGGVDPAILEIEVERYPGEWGTDDPLEQPAGVAVQLRVNNWADRGVLTRAQLIACSAISPYEQDWDAAPEVVGVRLLATVSEARLLYIKASADLDAGVVAEQVELGDLAPVTHAHLAKTSAIAAASIDGTAVRGLCGQWFVPRQDHGALPECEECLTRYEVFKAASAEAKN